KATDLGRKDAYLPAGLGLALEGLGRSAEADAAFREAFQQSSKADDEALTRLRLSYGFGVSARLPEKAGEAFAAVLQKNPNHPQALYGQAMLLMQVRADKPS